MLPMIDISELAAKERASHYRKLAADARREGDTAQSLLRSSYLAISEQWERLALAAEADTTRET